MTTTDVPQILDIPIGLDVSGTRRETDSLGAIDVPANRYWGTQTQRSLIHFSIGADHMPKEVYHAYGYVKRRLRGSTPAQPGCRSGKRT